VGDASSSSAVISKTTLSEAPDSSFTRLSSNSSTYNPISAGHVRGGAIGEKTIPRMSQFDIEGVRIPSMQSDSVPKI